ncbi:MAG: hypothetical protein AAF989_16535 [Planctomycetota bacterium]
MAKKKKTSTGFSLKDELFNRDRVKFLAGQFQVSDPQFDSNGFIKSVMKDLLKLELKERIVHIATKLEEQLPDDFATACRSIQAALPPALDPTLHDDDFGDFIMAPLGEFVVRNGLEKKHVKRSLNLLHAITQRFSMEDAIRYFINAHPEITLSTMEKWTKDSNYHVRRLVSEGTRPRLPWSGRLHIDVIRPLPFLDALHADETRYVTRSVSNHLNDIAKSDPDLVLKTLRRWKRLGLQDAAELDWMSRHALRTMVKQGHAGALKFLGFRPDPKIQVGDVVLSTQSVRPGEAIEFSFAVTAARAESLMVDYVIEFVKSNGSLAPKVHKIKPLDLAKGETVAVKKKHPFRANATTFKLYPGTHHLTIQINGKSFGRTSFEMSV